MPSELERFVRDVKSAFMTLYNKYTSPPTTMPSELEQFIHRVGTLTTEWLAETDNPSDHDEIWRCALVAARFPSWITVHKLCHGVLAHSDAGSIDVTFRSRSTFLTSSILVDGIRSKKEWCSIPVMVAYIVDTLRTSPDQPVV